MSQMLFKIKYLIFLFLPLLAVFSSCGEEEPIPISVESVEINKSYITLEVGQTEKLNASVLPSNAADKRIEWISQDPSIASVDSNGNITANSVGSTIIYVETHDGGYTAECTVEVISNDIPVERVTISHESLSLNVGDEYTLTADVYPSDATNKKLTWSSNNTSVATVNNGKVVALKEGNASITVMSDDGGHSASCVVNIEKSRPSWGLVGTFNEWGLNGHKDTAMSESKFENYYIVENVTFTQGTEFKFRYNNDWGENYGLESSEVTLTTNKRYNLVFDGANIIIKDKGTYDIYLSKSLDYFYIMNSGSMAPEDAIEAGGETKPSWGICGTMNNWGQSGDLDIEMHQSAYDNYYVATGVKLTTNDEFKFRYNNNWEKNYGGDQSISVFSINTKYSTVFDGKNISISKEGRYDIYLSKSYDNFYIMDENQSPDDAESSNINVTGVTLNKTSISLVVGETHTITCSVKPSNASDKSVQWKSNNTNVATVNNSGKITAISEGNAVITVKTNDGGHTAECEVIVTNQKVEDEIDLNSPSSITVSYSSNEYEISFTSANAWEATTDCDWITITPESGTSGNSSISVQISENTSTTQRTGSVTISSGTASVTVSYIQEGAIDSGNNGNTPNPDDYTKISLKVDMNSVANYEMSDKEWEDYINKSYTSANMNGYGTDFKHIEYSNGWLVIGFDGNVTTIPGVLPYAQYAKTIVLPNSVTNIGDKAFANNTTCTAINFPNSLQTIGKEAFAYATFIKDLELPESLTSIGQGAFFGCSNMTSVTLPSSLHTISTLAFSSSGISDIYIPSSVDNIEMLAFENCVSLKKVIIGNNTQVATMEIGSKAFNGCSSLMDLIIGSEVKIIREEAFDNCISLNNLELCAAIKCIIENYTVDSCTTLQSVVIPGTVAHIGEQIFRNCTALKTLKIGDNSNIANMVIGQNAFKDCSALSDVVIGSDVKLIEHEAFANCYNLVNLTLGENLSTSTMEIGERAFSNCTSIYNIIFGSDVNIIGNESFEECSSLESLIIPKTVSVIGTKAFLKCTSLKKLIIGENEPSYSTHIHSYAFWECTSLIETTLNHSVSLDHDISDCLFADCTGTLYINCPLNDFDNPTIGDNGIEDFGTRPFASSKFATIIVNDNIEKIGANTFNGTLCQDIRLGNNTQHIGESAFQSCTLKDFVLPKSVKTIALYAFAYSEIHNHICLHNDLTIEDRAFWEAYVENLEIMKNTIFDKIYHSTIDKSPFHSTSGNLVTHRELNEDYRAGDIISPFEFSNFSSITIGDNVTKITAYTYGNHNGTTKTVILGSNISEISTEAFEDSTTDPFDRSDPDIDTVYIKALTPPNCSGYNDTPFDLGATIYVPKDAVEKYKNANGWKHLNIVGYDF